MHSKALTIGALLLLTFGAPLSAFADLKIVMVQESDLPFALSSSRFSNSPANFKNSIANFKNSGANLANSEANFKNSAANYTNGRNGNQRLLLEQTGQYYFVGYYVRSDNGVLNFFSSDGTRLFYSPPGTDALFDADEGDFCGTLATLRGEQIVALTEAGRKALLAPR